MSALRIVHNEDRVWPRQQTVSKGDIVLIVCDSKTVPYWYHDAKPVPSDLQTGSSIVILGMEYTDYGVYTCIGKNRQGQVFKANSKLIVNSK